MQTVDATENKLFWELLNACQERTGVPLVLNTSFNGRGQPIVCTPEEAIDTFLAARLDVLVIGNFLVKPKPANGNE